MRKIQMVDLKSQYEKIKVEIDQAVIGVIESTQFINGSQVKIFQANLEKYLDVKHVIPCANGTDALQIALMACGLEIGDEVIVPTFTFVATAEVIGLLNLKPVMVDVDENTFNITAEIIEKAITPRTKAIVPVHLYGQTCDMEAIMQVAEKYGLFVIEDNAQAIGSDYTFADGTQKKSGTIGHIGCTSFYPSKNLGCYGDGGAIFTDDDSLAEKIRVIANHGQTKTYFHDLIGVNSRLDSIQAAILNIKLARLDEYCDARRKVADFYDEQFAKIKELETPFRAKNSTHVFHQYTLQVKNGKRDEFNEHLKSFEIPTMIYYPVPLYKQKAFAEYVEPNFSLPTTEKLCESVISLPMHTEMDAEQLEFIAEKVKGFCRK
jgi:dTDP-4-amino-4,6-dideoxygalactose transaminase